MVPSIAHHAALTKGRKKACSRRESRTPDRYGQAMIEFAVISLVLVGILAAILAFGMMFLQFNALQNAGGSAARFLDLKFSMTALETHLSHKPTKEDLLAELESPANGDPAYFDDAKLILTSAEWENRSSLPAINRWLTPIYIYDPDLDRYRFPGAVVLNANGEQTVLVPIVGSRDPLAGTETISRWITPVDIEPVDAATVATGEFDWELIVTFPSQSSSLVAYMPQGNGENTPIEADDNAVVESVGLPAGYSFATPVVDSDIGASASRGKFGLGESEAFLIQVRPYRKVVESRVVFRLANP